MNNFNIKQKRHGIFVLGHQHQTRTGKIKTNKTQQILAKTIELEYFLTGNEQLIRDGREIKQENMIHIYDVTINDVTGGTIISNYFNLRKITRNYSCDILSCNIDDYLIKRQSERHIIMQHIVIC